MQTINELLDIAKDKNDISSDRQLGLALGTGNLTRYRRGHEIPSDTTAIRLAELCKMKPEVVISICHAAKAKTAEESSVWNHMYKMAISAAVGGVILSGGVSVMPANTGAAEAPTMAQAANYNGVRSVYYVK